MLWVVVWAVLAIDQLQIDYATRYGDPGDKWAGGRPAATRRLSSRKAWPKMLKNGCAHRSLPFGTKLKILHGSHQAFCWVIDRGPYGRRGGAYRGMIDLLPYPANLAGVTGRHLVVIRPVGELL